MRVEARVVQQRGGAADPRGDEDVARRLRPAAGRRAPHEVAGPGVEPVLGLHALAGEVALGVEDRLGLAGRAARERDEARVLLGQLGRARRLGASGSAPHGDPDRRAVPAGLRRAPSALRSSQTTTRGSVASRRSRRSFGAQLLGARQDDEALAEAGDHRRRPTRAGCRRASGRRRRAGRRGASSARGEPGRAVGDLAEAPTRAATPSRASSTAPGGRDRRRRPRRARSSSARRVYEPPGGIFRGLRKRRLETDPQWP